MPGKHTFEYRLYPHAGGWERGKVARTAYEQNVPLMPVQSFGASRGMRPVQGLLTVTSDALVLAALKRSEDGRSVIVRLSNPTRKTIEADVESPLGIRAASLCTMAEKRGRTLRVFAKKRVRIEAGPKKVVTLRLNIANRK
jgi:alpha-mannosidase